MWMLNIPGTCVSTESEEVQDVLKLNQRYNEVSCPSPLIVKSYILRHTGCILIFVCSIVCGFQPISIFYSLGSMEPSLNTFLHLPFKIILLLI